ncbi:MAG: hypothetical protein BYD32DRAFT_419263 [Podila humilis]|nr:MAG: hypothetical protein BYD32DRAFT_419263 [Podila humilis]
MVIVVCRYVQLCNKGSVLSLSFGPYSCSTDIRMTVGCSVCVMSGRWVCVLSVCVCMCAYV